MRPEALVDAPDRPITEGSRVAGYRVDRVLCRRPGLYTTVHATAPNGGRVSLQIVTREISDDKELCGRILALAKVRASVKHPSLLPVRRAGQQGRWLYIANPIARGHTLADRLTDGPLPADEAIAVLDQVSAGLEAAAARGLIHRELEPANIFLSEGPPVRALLTDFGIAIPDRRACDLVSMVEGAAYTSPEAVRGEGLQVGSNVYSLGCILFECLTGTPPFQKDRPLLTFHAHLVEPPPSVSERNKDLPPALDVVIAKAMAKNPADRFDSPSQLMLWTRRAFDVNAPVPVPERIVERPVRTSPAKGKAPAPGPTAERRRTRRRATRRSRARLMPLRNVPALVLSMLLLATMCGFALGSVKGSRASRNDPPRVARAAAPAVDRAAQLRRTTYIRNVNEAMTRLVKSRRVGLQRLRDARRRGTQAAAAAALARAYGQARKAIASSSAPDDARVLTAARAAEVSYRRLAAAARRGDRRAFLDARHAVASQEAALDSALEDLAQRA